MPAAKAVPLGANGWDQIMAGPAEPPSFCFQTRYACPVTGSMKGLGSMEPVGWQSRGLPESVNWALVGLRALAVATARQSNPVSPG